ncbi:MAG: DHH family phosphoesterase [Bacteroidaceae bacterium]|nr:DHH family phosphoesterase [Bacteroidaceae bacterium]
MNTLLTSNQITLWHQLLKDAKHIVITCHRGPDGDAIGSTTALVSWLRRSYPATDIRIVAPNIFPDFLKWVPGAEDILIYDKHEADVRPVVEAADLIIMCDHGELSRMWTLGDVIRPLLPIGGAPEGRTRCIMIDHHLNPESGIADLAISHPDLSSTCEVLLRIILELSPSPDSSSSSPDSSSSLPASSSSSPDSSSSLPASSSPSPASSSSSFGCVDGVFAVSPTSPVSLSSPPLTHDEAVCLYTGMMTDTGAFTYASSRPEIFQLISILLRCGIDKDKIYRNVFFTYSPNRMKFQGYMLYVKLDVWKKAHTSIMTLTNAERRRFGILNGDTEGLVNLPLQILGMKLSVFLREDTEHPCIRVSLRSVDDFPCNELAAEFFGGGGHKNAAGGEIWGTMDEALALIKKAVQKYMPFLKS